MDSVNPSANLDGIPSVNTAMNRLTQLSAIAGVFGLVSCAAVCKIGEQTGSKISQLSALAANEISPPGVKIVEVREKDLKKQPSGRELALAYENTRKSGSWLFGGPVDFKEPTLPEPGAEMDGGLLPPKTP
jgi:hypothetical protein